MSYNTTNTNTNREPKSVDESKIGSDGQCQEQVIARQEVGKVENQNIDLSQGIKSDRWAYRIVIGGFLTTIMSCLMATVILQASNIKTPELLTPLATNALTALAALIAPAQSRD